MGQYKRFAGTASDLDNQPEATVLGIVELLKCFSDNLLYFGDSAHYHKPCYS